MKGRDEEMYFVQNAFLSKAPASHHFLLESLYTEHQKNCACCIGGTQEMSVLFEENLQNNGLQKGPSLSSFYAVKII